jgi:predicted GNAT superfamily acetyltransferase
LGGLRFSLAFGLISVYKKSMNVSVNEKPEKRPRGRPATGQDPVLAFRIPAEIKHRVEEEAAERGETPTETLRRIVTGYFKRKK